MENIIFDSGGEDKEGGDPTEEELLEAGGISSREEAFMKGYSEEEKIITCDECGMAIKKEKITKRIDGEAHKFCSEECAKEFAEGMN